MKILFIGANSKIARNLISKFNNYEIHATFSNQPSNEDYHKTYQLDLADETSIVEFINITKYEYFDVVFLCAATYEKDEENIADFLDQANNSLMINAIAPIAILTKLNYTKHAKIFLFGDAGVDNPKKNYMNYTLSKNVLHNMTKILAVQMADIAAVYLFKLGPTKPAVGKDEAQYKNKTLYKVNSPIDGLSDFCKFIIENKNLSMTGSEIVYDGGTYLKR